MKQLSLPYLVEVIILRIQRSRSIASILIILMLGACGPKEISRQEKVEALIKESLNDPDSAKFDNLYEKDGYGCILVNAKNSFGGYPGKRPVLLIMDGNYISVIQFANRDDTTCYQLVAEAIEQREEQKFRTDTIKRMEAELKDPKRPKDPNIGNRSGETIYKAVCGACHEAGVAGAPKIGDVAAWKPRIKNGLEPLIQSAKKGKNAMPPRGGSDATDDELRLTIIYMVNRSGGRFK